MLVTINIVLIKRGKDNANNYKDNVSKKGEIMILILIKSVNKKGKNNANNDKDNVNKKGEMIILIMMKRVLIKWEK